MCFLTANKKVTKYDLINWFQVNTVWLKSVGPPRSWKLNWFEKEMEAALPFVAMVVGLVAQVGLVLAGQKAIATGMHNFSYIF